MKTEIITKEKPKEFEPFELRITFETLEEANTVFRAFDIQPKLIHVSVQLAKKLNSLE
jgi:hypothetical protein